MIHWYEVVGVCLAAAVVSFYFGWLAKAGFDAAVRRAVKKEQSDD